MPDLFQPQTGDSGIAHARTLRILRVFLTHFGTKKASKNTLFAHTQRPENRYLEGIVSRETFPRNQKCEIMALAGNAGIGGGKGAGIQHSLPVSR